jgi:hypothetical protein
MSSECVVTEYTDDSRKDSLEDFNDTDKSEHSNFKDTSNVSNDMLNKSELEKLIIILKKGIKDNEPGIKYIKYPDLLVKALEDLNSMIGLHRIKESAAIQTVRLIENLKAGEKSMQMLNTVITAGAGLGKTSVGIKLAKIWFALGFLDPHPNSNTTTTTTKKNTFFEAPKGGQDMTAIAFLLIAWIGTYVIQLLSYTYNKIGLFWLAFFIGFFILVIVFVYYSDKEGKWITKYIKEEVTEEKLKTATDRDIITVVSRNDFVGEYLGHTSGKTRKLLEANIGKVLFIDEAYSLLNDPRDAYGYEALNMLNLFLSENPDKIVVIFAGYKDQMKNSIFLAQPGLERRCMWTFSVDPYSGEELAEIFFLQAKQENWKINDIDKIKIKRLIMKNESAFKAFGGDTARLVYLSSLEASRSNLSGISETFLSTVEEEKGRKKDKILTFHDVEQGLISLKENRM